MLCGPVSMFTVVHKYIQNPWAHGYGQLHAVEPSGFARWGGVCRIVVPPKCNTQITQPYTSFSGLLCILFNRIWWN